MIGALFAGVAGMLTTMFAKLAQREATVATMGSRMAGRVARTTPQRRSETAAVRLAREAQSSETYGAPTSLWEGLGQAMVYSAYAQERTGMAADDLETLNESLQTAEASVATQTKTAAALEAMYGDIGEEIATETADAIPAAQLTGLPMVSFAAAGTGAVGAGEEIERRSDGTGTIWPLVAVVGLYIWQKAKR